MIYSNGGNKRLYLDRELPEIELEWLFMKMCCYLREKYGSTNFRRKIAEFSKDTGIILNRKGYPVISIVEPEHFNKDILISDTNTYQNNKKLPKPILFNIGFGKNLLKLSYQVNFNNENGNSVYSGKENGRTSYRIEERGD